MGKSDGQGYWVLLWTTTGLANFGSRNHLKPLPHVLPARGPIQLPGIALSASIWRANQPLKFRIAFCCGNVDRSHTKTFRSPHESFKKPKIDEGFGLWQLGARFSLVQPCSS